MPKPEKCPSNNPKDIEFFILGWNSGQEELRNAIHNWMSNNLERGDEVDDVLRQSLLSAMEHS